MAQRKTKYSHLTPTLQKLPLVEPERRDIVNAVKEEILASVSEGPFNEGPFIDSPFYTVEVPQASVREGFEVLDRTIKPILTQAKHLTGGKRHASVLAESYMQLRAIKDIIATWQSSVQLLLDAYTELMVDQLEVEGMSGLKLGDGRSITTYDEPVGVVKDKEAFRLWCIKNGYETKLQMWPSTMNSLVKERLMTGEEEPDGVEVFARTVVKQFT